MKHTRIIVFAVAAVMSLMLCACGANDVSDSGSSAANVPHEKVMPTFKYFHTNEETETVEPIINELKEEYEGKVNFDIVNVDENAEILENFQLVSGNTPTLIMLNTDNDISKIELQCTDVELLKADIEDALQ